MMDGINLTVEKKPGKMNCTVTLEFCPLTVEFEEYMDAAMRGYYVMKLEYERFEDN